MLVPNVAFHAVSGKRLSAGVELCARYASQGEHSLRPRWWERTRSAKDGMDLRQVVPAPEILRIQYDAFKEREHRFYAGRTLDTRDKQIKQQLSQFSYLNHLDSAEMSRKTIS